MKDKKAITRQRISIYKSALNKIGGQNAFLEALSEVSKVIKTNRHSKPIGLTTHINNIFYIRLRAQKNLSQEERDIATTSMKTLFEKGFLNQYGVQRFGVDERNWAE